VKISWTKHLPLVSNSLRDDALSDECTVDDATALPAEGMMGRQFARRGKQRSSKRFLLASILNLVQVNHECVVQGVISTHSVCSFTQRDTCPSGFTDSIYYVVGTHRLVIYMQSHCTSPTKNHVSPHR